jgi:hypothetical protein
MGLNPAVAVKEHHLAIMMMMMNTKGKLEV